MKKFASSILALATASATSAFVFPIHFQAAVKCSNDASCTYATIQPGEGRHDQAAATAKAGYGKVLQKYKELYN